MSILKSICLQNFLGYVEPQSMDFAIPNDQPGSGLTLIVGEINSGKSSIFEAIKKLSQGAKFFPKERNPKDSYPLIKFVDKDDKITTVEMEKKPTVSISEDGSVNSSIFELVPSRRHWRHIFSASDISGYDSYRTHAFHSSERYQTDDNLGGLLEKIADDPSKKSTFDKMLKSLFPSFSDWKIDCNDQGQDIVLYHIDGQATHDTSLIGDGLVSLFRICSHLVLTNSQLVLYIDEPELSLSPSVQKHMAQLLAEQAKNKQIIVNTHSPHMIRWEDIAAGAKVYRTKKYLNGKCEIKSLNSESDALKKLFSKEPEWQKPHLLDAVAKEIFFSEKALFLEGQEDVGLIRKFIKDNKLCINFDIFGYGCDGAGNIPVFLEISKNLGIKAAALFDNSPKSGTDIQKAQKYEEENKENFKVIVHDYEDIRVKSQEKSRKTKTGLFEEDGSISPEKKEKMDGHLKELIEFFNS